MGSPTEEFGPYTVYEQLGFGGMATVHRAEAQGIAGFSKQVALKRMLPSVASNATLVKSFIREAQLASRLHHANVAQTYDLGRVGNTYFIAMELVLGRNLREILKHCSAVAGNMPLPIAMNIVNQICDALDYAHNLCDESGQPLNIIHRDVSPSNIIVGEGGVVKLIDFGIAKASAHGMNTMSGTIKGKFSYMAPEYLMGSIDARADLFALGVIAHELLSNRPLFQGKDDMDTLYRVKDMQILPPSTYNRKVPPELDAIIMTALDRDPEQRWQRATALRGALTTETKRLGLVAHNQQVVEWLEWAFQQRKREPSSSDDEPLISISGGTTELPQGSSPGHVSNATSELPQGSPPFPTASPFHQMRGAREVPTAPSSEVPDDFRDAEAMATLVHRSSARPLPMRERGWTGPKDEKTQPQRPPAADWKVTTDVTKPAAAPIADDWKVGSDVSTAEVPVRRSTPHVVQRTATPVKGVPERVATPAKGVPERTATPARGVAERPHVVARGDRPSGPIATTDRPSGRIERPAPSRATPQPFDSPPARNTPRPMMVPQPAPDAAGIDDAAATFADPPRRADRPSKPGLGAVALRQDATQADHLDDDDDAHSTLVPRTPAPALGVADTLRPAEVPTLRPEQRTMMAADPPLRPSQPHLASAPSQRTMMAPAPSDQQPVRPAAAPVPVPEPELLPEARYPRPSTAYRVEVAGPGVVEAAPAVDSRPIRTLPGAGAPPSEPLGYPLSGARTGLQMRGASAPVPEDPSLGSLLDDLEADRPYRPTPQPQPAAVLPTSVKTRVEPAAQKSASNFLLAVLVLVAAGGAAAVVYFALPYLT